MSENPAPQAQAPDAEAATSETPAAPHPWADLPAEQFSLLRLAPLPVDRETGPRPLRFVQLGRVERHAKDMSLLRLRTHWRLRAGNDNAHGAWPWALGVLGLAAILGGIAAWRFRSGS